MQQQPPATEFGIAEARRVLGEVFAPWVMDLNLAIERFDFAPSGDAADWQPGAVLRLPFSERLCRNGGTVSGQALMAFADTAMVIANLAANRGYRPMTTVDQTTHFMRAVSASDVLADARVVRLGRTMSFGRVTLLVRHRQQAGGDGVQRIRDAVGNAGWGQRRAATCPPSISEHALPHGGHASLCPPCEHHWGINGCSAPRSAPPSSAPLLVGM